MGVLTRLGGVFKKKSDSKPVTPAPKPAAHRPASTPPSTGQASAGQPSAAEPAPRVNLPRPLPKEPVMMETDDEHFVAPEPKPEHRSAPESASPELEPTPMPIARPADAPVAQPKNRQELLTELQKNYSEVVSLVRKVDQHLDQQERRSARLLEIAETIPGSLQQLPAIREESAKLNGHLEKLLARQIDDAADASAQRQAQTEALGNVRELIEKSRETEREVAESLEAFRGSVGEMSNATGTLGSVLEQMREGDRKRDTQLAELIAGNNRAMITVVSLGAAAAVIVLVVLLAG